MKIIVAGSREIKEIEPVYACIEKGLKELGLTIDDDIEIVSGCAKGVDSTAIIWAMEFKKKWHEFPADWNNISVPFAIVRTNRFGSKYNSQAGFDRNQKMADFSDALIAIKKKYAKCSGTKDMIRRAYNTGLKVVEYEID